MASNISNKKIQDYLFEQVKQLLPPGTQLVDAIAPILHLSNDSAYRRIRGETPLILEEAQSLCSHYNLSLDEALRSKKGAVTFQVMGVNNKDNDFEQYWSNLLQTMQLIYSFQKKEIIYLSKDMPFFHNFCYPELFAFRHFFWMKSILRHPDFENRQFTLDCITPKIANLGREILKTYNNIPSTEIWNSESINSTLSQIDHFKEGGYFKSNADVIMLYDTLRKTIEHIQAETEYGCKFLPGDNPHNRKENFTLFYNRVVLGDNTILIRHDDRKTLYLNYDVLNYMYTQDAEFCEDVQVKLQNLMRRATILSKVSEKQRSFFFNALYRKIDNCKKTVA
jgi:hypothetical protein